MPSRLIALRTLGARPLGRFLGWLGVAALAGAVGSAPADGALFSLRTGGGARVTANAAVAGSARAAVATQPLSPAQIHAAYALPERGAARQTIAVVSVYDDPAIQSDLAGYSKRFKLPACTEANGCLGIHNEEGNAAPLPGPDPTAGQWVTESAIGVELAHGVCESCRVRLIEGSSPAEQDIAASVATAARAGATVIVTSITPYETDSGLTYESEFTRPKAAVVAAAGDGLSPGAGYTGRLDYPASLPNVLAVGGTSLSLGRGGAYAGEQAWTDTVTGCSPYSAAAPWQLADAAKVGCGAERAVADLAAVADPGAVVRVTGSGLAGGPWYGATGTSVAAPIIAGVIGLAGSAGSREAQILYARARTDPGAFHDIRTGATAPGCTSPICQAAPGYDGPTGLGTPFGLAAFLPSGGALNPRHPAITVAGATVHVSTRSTALLGLRNGNPFAVTGTIVLRRTLRLSGHLRLIKFATGKLALAPLAKLSEKLTIAKRYRGLLRRLGSVEMYAQLHVRGPAGRAVTVSKRLVLQAG